MAYSLPSSSSGYDVFLSFRGEDTRKNFVDHLHIRLCDQNIRTFKDDVNLRSGRDIAPELLEAIEESRFAIVVFSKNYANSTWCLDELVKIIQCKSLGLIVFPVFYDVEPTEVRNQKGSYAEAFAWYEEYSPDKVDIWRDALSEAASISGWDAYALYMGKEPCMLPAEELIIEWGSNADFWMWRTHPDSRFYSKVAYLVRINHLDIQGKLRTNELFANTTYGVFLVFKLATRYSGLQSAKATVTDGRVYDEASCTVYLTFECERRYRNEEVPTSRGDGWMEVKMGEFYNGEGHDREVVARVMQHSDFEKSGLIVGGIEFHPLD
ncbi:hypothetical protein RJ640_005752 [Escallonia rubra]|uniref:ADP-ribosyl cyclase/cyclic ADP-ribose hydrolase n=1 Tax=Escallonia rubra TaxID=112253 RepID=A0AA88RG97_9ASTE|nr:hypothetical protein RJ640_005752 [Escallonia rubra]